MVEVITREAAVKRRNELLRRLGEDLEGLRERGRAYLLDADELASLNELEDLDFLISSTA